MTTDDFIALTQQEAYNIFKERGITHIIYTGRQTVHGQAHSKVHEAVRLPAFSPVTSRKP
jgi:hypothetical protein